MKTLRLLLIILILGFNENYSFTQLEAPRIVALNASTNCNTGEVTIYTVQCLNKGWLLDHITWNMGGTTTPFETQESILQYQYEESGTYTISASATFVSQDGDILEVPVFHHPNSASTSLEKACLTPDLPTFQTITIAIFDGYLSLNPSEPLTANTNCNILLNYMHSYPIAVNSYFNFIIDGVIVSTGAISTLPLSGSIVYSAVITEGQHVLEYEIVDERVSCNISIVKIIEVLPPPPPCSTCFTFKPEPGTPYWVSAWVKEVHKKPVMNYSEAFVEIEFVGSTSAPVNFHTTGEIIDDWQRIVGEFIIPEGTTELNIYLSNVLGNGVAFFDDVRIHPFNASMKSYVYDPVTFLLTAELDDNNYATFYEYDKEGQLIRIKKETARGVMTIQESRSSNPKE